MRKSFHAEVVAVLSAAAVTVGALLTHAAAAGADPYTPVQTQDNAEFAIADGYIVKQMNCTPELSPAFESLTWDLPGFTPEGGTGMIHDANPGLGGPFAARWAGDYWDVEYQFC
ncbi:hypothetical protein [Mycolicibacterium tusciae]|uniref:hypothetical protein n=1 Tax=Mycolicibacterium tusciae TaxID=75922 RepID=UPI00024A472E|nr:hypothetical protein [Mycolicibacterium tusciae]